jgi:hypothetical protein
VVEAGDGQSISTSVVGNRESWDISPYNGPAVSVSIRAVVNKYRGNKGVTGPQNVTPYTRHGATIEDGTPYSPDGTDHLAVLDNNPDTGVPWEPADLATLQVGVKADI